MLLARLLIKFVYSSFSLNFPGTSQDCELLYLSGRPENLIMTTIAVPPIAIRPSVIIDGSQRSFCSPFIFRFH